MKSWNGTVCSLLFVIIPLLACTTGNRGARVDQEIQNLRTFARLYGYVQYFHPSDEASAIDWDSFAIHGSRRVRSAASTEELRACLEELFLPIAPSVRIYRQGRPPERMYHELFPDTTELKTVTWQHKGHGHGLSKVYESRRLNRMEFESGMTINRLDAREYQGRGIRFRAAVRADVRGRDNHGLLWLETSRENREIGFSDDMTDRPIREGEWNTYEITGTLDDDAMFVSFGCKLIGQGRMWIDELELSVESDDLWQVLELHEPGFEEDLGERLLLYWERRSPGYRHTVTEERPFSGNRCLLIASRQTDDPWFLFPSHATIGESVEKPLGGGLRCRVPLALYSDETSTLPQADKKPHGALEQELQRVADDSLGIEDQDLRFADVIITWNVLQHFYPYFDVVDVDWDTTLTEALQWARDAEDPREFLYSLRKLIARLQDGHGTVDHDMESELAYLPIGVQWIEDQAVVTASADTTRFKIGDIVETIDGRSPRAIFLEDEQYLSGSPHKKRTKALKRFGLGERGSTAELTIRRGSETIRVTASRELETSLPVPERPVFEELEDGIYFVDLNKMEMPQLSEHIEELSQACGIVFDLRRYPAGNHMIISHLTEKPVRSPRWMIPQIIYPDHEHVAGYDTTGRWTLEPEEPLITGKVVFLTSSDAMSYAESFLGIIEHYRLGEIIGEPTGGANGNANILELPGGFKVCWTGMRVLKHDGSQHHLIGIQPTVPVQRTIAGVIKGRDEFLDKAVEIIKKGTRVEGGAVKSTRGQEG